MCSWATSLLSCLNWRQWYHWLHKEAVRKKQDNDLHPVHAHKWWLEGRNEDEEADREKGKYEDSYLFSNCFVFLILGFPQMFLTYPSSSLPLAKQATSTEDGLLKTVPQYYRDLVGKKQTNKQTANKQKTSLVMVKFVHKKATAKSNNFLIIRILEPPFF